MQTCLPVVLCSLPGLTLLSVATQSLLSLCVCVCVCAGVAGKASSRQSSGRRRTADAPGMKSTTLFWKKAHFLRNMKEKVLPMLLFMHTKSMFVFQVELQ